MADLEIRGSLPAHIPRQDVFQRQEGTVFLSIACSPSNRLKKAKSMRWKTSFIHRNHSIWSVMPHSYSQVWRNLPVLWWRHAGNPSKSSKSNLFRYRTNAFCWFWSPRTAMFRTESLLQSVRIRSRNWRSPQTTWTNILLDRISNKSAPPRQRRFA